MVHNKSDNKEGPKFEIVIFTMSVFFMLRVGVIGYCELIEKEFIH